MRVESTISSKLSRSDILTCEISNSEFEFHISDSMQYLYSMQKVDIGLSIG